MTLVPGDPASLSACAGTAHSVAARLAEATGGVRTASDGLGEGWAGRRSAGVRRRTARLADAALEVSTQVERVARVLQDHATDLADLVARGRALDERAAAAGLEMRDGRVELAWGVTGTADAVATREREEVRAALQGALDLVLAQHRRRRDWLLGVLRESTTRLDEASRNLRGG